MMKPLRLTRALVSLAAVLLLLAACSGPEDEQKSTSASGWSEYISEHTGQEVSKKAKIRIRFVHPVIDDNQVGQDAGTFLKLEPVIEGSASFSNTREILLIPEQPLQSGTQYKATVKGKGLKGIPAALGDYRFDFRVKPQNFEVVVSSLAVDSANEDNYILTGQLTTADVESAENVTRLLTVRYNDQPLTLSWGHATDGLHHTFTIPAIPRGNAPGSLVLAWDGTSIAVDNRGQQQLQVPALGVFNVSHMSVVKGERRYIEVNFSETLDSAQNLNGLIRIADTAFTAAIDGNILKIYPQGEVTGEVSVTLEPGIKSAKGRPLATAVTRSVVFTAEKPGVRFAGKGVILPANE